MSNSYIDGVVYPGASGTEYGIGSPGTLLSDQMKQALLACFANVAWIDDDGQDYYDALEDALYPVTPPATLVSISAVYTQSGTVYDTDTLDSLKSDLVVTAHYDDSSTAVIPTGYTLSGTLTAGTSTITVSYSGKTTTFNVTVTAAPLYAFEDAVNEETDYRITTTKSGHIKIEILNQMSTTNAGYAINVNTRKMGDSGGANAVSKAATPIFQLPANKSITSKVENITNTTGKVVACALKEQTTSNTIPSISGFSMSDIETTSSATNTLTSAQNVGCVFLYINLNSAPLNAGGVIELDYSLTVDGVRWV